MHQPFQASQSTNRWVFFATTLVIAMLSLSAGAKACARNINLVEARTQVSCAGRNWSGKGNLLTPKGWQQNVPSATSTIVQRPQRKRLAPLRSSETLEGSRVMIISDARLNDYSAYVSGGRYYVVIPEADGPRTLGNTYGRGFEDAQVQTRGSDVILSFRLQKGTTARVSQKFHTLVVIFVVPVGSVISANATEDTAKAGTETSTSSHTSMGEQRGMYPGPGAGGSLPKTLLGLEAKSAEIERPSSATECSDQPPSIVNPETTIGETAGPDAVEHPAMLGAPPPSVETSAMTPLAMPHSNWAVVEELRSLMSIIRSHNLEWGVEDRWDTGLKRVAEALASVKSGAVATACKQLDAYITGIRAEVLAQVQLDNETIRVRRMTRAGRLTAIAQQIKSSLSCH